MTSTRPGASPCDDGTYLVSRVTLTVYAPELDAEGSAFIEEPKRFCAYSKKRYPR